MSADTVLPHANNLCFVSAFPDFFKNATKQWWVEMHKEFHKTLPFDAIWIGMFFANRKSNVSEFNEFLLSQI